MMQKRIAILGGGIAGLATAHYLQRSGFATTIFEASSHLGGLGADFIHRGIPIEKFYHVMINSDHHLLGLAEELGLTDRIHWQKTGMGFFVDGKHYAFNTPLDLLRFGGLNVFDRLRTGVASLALSRREDGNDLDDVPVDTFLRQQFGERAFENLWKPLLRSKFGELYSHVPAYWFWSRMKREKGSGPEVKGHIRGGYRQITNALENTILRGEGRIYTDSPVTELRTREEGASLRVRGREERYDAVVSTLPLPLLHRISSGGLEDEVPLPNLIYQGVVNVAVISKQPLQNFYWNAVLDKRYAFQGLVETTQVIPLDWTGGRHIYYMMNYCQPDSTTYQQTDLELKRSALRGLATLYPHFAPEAVEDLYVFRAPHVEPVWPIGYRRHRPEVRVGNSNVYLSTTAQAYPMVNSWNTSVALARQTAEKVTLDMRQRRSVTSLALA